MKTVDTVKLLIKRNKRALLQELRESKEAVYLISKATHSKLTSEEKIKIKLQLIDICKSIPAFTIFMLPGGAILLPLLIKLIPTILPSAFKDIDNEIK
jgi:hypothetical protein